jgi:anti-anti-sigma factor
MPITTARPTARQPTPGRQAPSWVVRVQAGLERDTRAQFWDQIDTAVTHPRVIIDLRQVRFVDSAGLHALVSAVRRIRAHGGQVHLRSAPGIVHQRLIQVGVDRVAAIQTTTNDRPAASRRDERRPHNRPASPAHDKRRVAVRAAGRSAQRASEHAPPQPPRPHHPARAPPSLWPHRRRTLGETQVS